MENNENINNEIEIETESEEISGTCSLNLVATVSSLLFVSSKPLKLETLSEITNVSTEDLQIAMDAAGRLFDDKTHGFSLHKVNGGFQFRSAPEALPVIKKLKPNRGRRLSRAAAETLAVIAYKQPVQRSEIESIRGVDALPTLKTLLDAKLIRIIGREDSVGSPVLYGTTPEFLEVFGLSDLSELPSAHEINNLANEPGEIEEPDLQEAV